MIATHNSKLCVATLSAFLLLIFLSVTAFGATPSANPPLASPPAQQPTQQTENRHADYTPTYIASAISLFVCLGAACMVHIFSSRRDRAAREHADRKEKEAKRAELLATLKHWENTFVIVTDPQRLTNLYYEGGGMRELAVAAEKFRGYVADRDAFDRLNRSMSAMNQQALMANGSAWEQVRETICSSIRTFYDFNRNA